MVRIRASLWVCTAAGLLCGAPGLTLESESVTYGAAQSRFNILRAVKDIALGAKFDASQCQKYPGYCKEPFSCDTKADPAWKSTFGLARNGHANMQLWCGMPNYYDYLTVCNVDRDLKKAAQVQYNWSLAQKIGIDELDASYCFAEGHCTNAAVTENTTLLEAEGMCDSRYGHGGWTRWSLAAEAPRLVIGGFTGGLTFDSGFHQKKLTQIFAKAACAMGNFHCDVVYCKETYCKMDYYKAKYEHLSPKVPGHLVKQTFWKGPI